MACIMHPGKKHPNFFFTLQMFVSFTMFLEAAALIPQLAHLHQNKDTDGLNSYYLMCLGVARLCRVGFWITMSTKRDSFWYLVMADVLHTILLGAFFAFYKKAKTSKDSHLGGFQGKTY